MTIVEKSRTGQKFILLRDEVFYFPKEGVSESRVVILVSPNTNRWYAVDEDRFRSEYREVFI